MELPEQKKLLSSGYECVMHMHAIAAQISISKVDCRMEKGTGKKVPATFLRSGEKGVCILKVKSCIFRLSDLFALKNLNSCQVWEDSP